jgi:type IV secretory pathway TraG/TraD family ATPase VirD4
LGAIASRLEREGNPGRAVVFVDELSAFEGDQLAGALARARSAGISYIVATQSVSNYHTAGGQKLLDGMLDNSELVVIHRQSAPDAAEQLAGVAGTQEAWEHTHKVLDRTALRWHGDESGERARRLTDQFRAHPNTLTELAVGQAVLVRKRPAFAVDEITVDPPSAP